MLLGYFKVEWDDANTAYECGYLNWLKAGLNSLNN